MSALAHPTHESTHLSGLRTQSWRARRQGARQRVQLFMLLRAMLLLRGLLLLLLLLLLHQNGQRGKLLQRRLQHNVEPRAARDGGEQVHDAQENEALRVFKRQ
jgi:hypothetical protein